MRINLSRSSAKRKRIVSVKSISIEINGNHFHLEETTTGTLKIMKQELGEGITILPCVSNVIEIK